MDELMQEIAELYHQLRAQRQALAGQRDVVTRAAAQGLPDEIAVQVPLMYPAWDWQSCEQGMIVNYNGQLYRVLNTPTDNRTPDAEGMLAVYRPIVPGHDGTQDDPIPWAYGLDCKAGLYYSYEGRVWLCLSGMAPCVWAPGTAPTMWSVV